MKLFKYDKRKLVQQPQTVINSINQRSDSTLTWFSNQSRARVTECLNTPPALYHSHMREAQLSAVYKALDCLHPLSAEYLSRSPASIASAHFSMFYAYTARLQLWVNHSLSIFCSLCFMSKLLEKSSRINIYFSDFVSGFVDSPSHCLLFAAFFPFQFLPNASVYVTNQTPNETVSWDHTVKATR